MTTSRWPWPCISLCSSHCQCAVGQGTSAYHLGRHGRMPHSTHRTLVIMANPIGLNRNRRQGCSGGGTGSTSRARGLYPQSTRRPAGRHAYRQAAALHRSFLATSAAESSAQVPRALTCERVRPALMMPKTWAASSSG